MTDIKAALQGTDWLMTQSSYDAMAARASEENEFSNIRSERSGGTHTVYVHGPIVKNHDFFSLIFGAVSADDIISEIQQNQDADEIVLDMDTPGGEAKAGIPVTDAVFNSTVSVRTHASGNCASLGYMIAAASNSISAEKASLVGSIGAMTFFFGEDEDITIRSKNAPEKNSKADAQQIVDAYEKQFYEVITRGRNVTEQTIKETHGQGMAFIAEEALSRGMIDEVLSSAAPSASTNTQPENENMSGNNDGAITFNSAEDLQARDEQIESDARADERAKVLAEIEQEQADAKAEADRVEAEAKQRESDIKASEAAQGKSEETLQAVIDNPKLDTEAAIFALSLAAPAESSESTFRAEIDANNHDVAAGDPENPERKSSKVDVVKAKNDAIALASYEYESQGHSKEDALMMAEEKVSLVFPAHSMAQQ